MFPFLIPYHIFNSINHGSLPITNTSSILRFAQLSKMTLNHDFPNRDPLEAVHLEVIVGLESGSLPAAHPYPSLDPHFRWTQCLYEMEVWSCEMIHLCNLFSCCSLFSLNVVLYPSCYGKLEAMKSWLNSRKMLLARILCTMWLCVRLQPRDTGAKDLKTASWFLKDFKNLFIYLEDKEGREKVRQRSSVCWFTLQMPTAGLGKAESRSQELYLCLPTSHQQEVGSEAEWLELDRGTVIWDARISSGSLTHCT